MIGGAQRRCSQIDSTNPDFIPPDFGADKSVFEHSPRFAFRVQFRARVKDHHQRKRLVVPVKVNAIFATKPHAAENKFLARKVHEETQYSFEPIGQLYAFVPTPASCQQNRPDTGKQKKTRKTVAIRTNKD